MEANNWKMLASCRDVMKGPDNCYRNLLYLECYYVWRCHKIMLYLLQLFYCSILEYNNQITRALCKVPITNTIKLFLCLGCLLLSYIGELIKQNHIYLGESDKVEIEQYIDKRWSKSLGPDLGGFFSWIVFHWYI